MAKPNRLKAVEQEYGESLDSLIPRLLQELGSVQEVAGKLDISISNLLRWLSQNGYERRVKITWAKRRNANFKQLAENAAQ